jgi:tRNA pseudouridine55 synthase
VTGPVVRPIDGVVAVRKPAGPTSHDLVDRARHALGVRRIGHLGTLDPFAEGVLVLLVGRATRLSRYASGWPKVYEGVIRLGRVTTTDDGTGETLATSDTWRALSRERVAATLEGFRGSYEQRPPAYSAVKVGGERAYRLARRGETPALESRPVLVRDIELTSFEPPDAGFRAVVGGGTYLRAIARDLGERLGCGAHLAVLRRTAVGPFTLRDALPLDDLRPEALSDPAVLVRDLPRRDLDSGEREAVIHGRPVDPGPVPAAAGEIALFAGDRLVAVAERRDALLTPRVVVAEA